VDSEARSGDHGENRLASMPSIIVESGFHTNRSDAAALQDPVFRTAAMKGVEKGYRLHAQGVGCEPLKITETPDTSGPMGTHIPMEVHYEGHPRFPVVANVRVLRCPGSGICSDSRMTYTEKVPSPLKTEFECAGASDDSHTVLLRTTLTDADDVEAVSEHHVTCTTSRSPSEKSPASGSVPGLTAGPI